MGPNGPVTRYLTVCEGFRCVTMGPEILSGHMCHNGSGRVQRVQIGQVG